MVVWKREVLGRPVKEVHGIVMNILNLADVASIGTWQRNQKHTDRVFYLRQLEIGEGRLLVGKLMGGGGGTLNMFSCELIQTVVIPNWKVCKMLWEDVLFSFSEKTYHAHYKLSCLAVINNHPIHSQFVIILQRLIIWCH